MLDFLFGEKKVKIVDKEKNEEEHQTTFILPKVTRVEVIDHSKSFEEGGGRLLTKRNLKEVELSYQDNNTTLKIFIK